MNKLIEALQILLKYGDPTYPTACEHDILMISPYIKPKDVSIEDKKRLEELGFNIYTEFDDDGYFTSFRYGSA